MQTPLPRPTQPPQGTSDQPSTQPGRHRIHPCDQERSQGCNFHCGPDEHTWHLRPHWTHMEMGMEHPTQRNLQLTKTCGRLWIPPNSVEDIDCSCHTEAKL